MLGGRLWRHTDFLKLWSGQTISQLGSAVTTLALPTIAIFQLRATPFQVGLLLALQRLAFPFVAPFAGVYIDRVSRRRVMILTDVGRMVLLASIPAAALSGALTMVQLYAVALLSGVLSVFFDLAGLALLPGMVLREDLLEGNAKFQFSLSFTQLAGPAFAGLLISAVGAARAIAVDAASYLVSWVSLLFIRAPERPAPRRTDARVLAGIMDGAHHVFRNPILRSLILTVGFSIFGGHAVEAVEYPFAYYRLGLTPGVFGLILSIAGVGAIIGALVASVVTHRLGVGTTIALTGILIGLAQTAFAAAVRLPVIPVLVVANLLLGIADPIHNLNQMNLRQAMTPDHLQGRMNAAFRTVFWGAWPLGNLIGGYLGSRLGLIPVIIGGGVWTSAVSAIVFFTPLAKVGEHPTMIEETSPR
jgi:MFS family permease